MQTIKLLHTEEERADWCFEVDHTEALKHAASFQRWANANPDACRLMYARSLAWAKRGQRSSIKRLFEQLRFDSGLRIKDVEDGQKLSNTYSALVARLLIKANPAFASVYKVRGSYFDTLTDDELPRVDWGNRG